MKKLKCEQCGVGFKSIRKRRFCPDCARLRNIDQSKQSYLRRREKDPELMRENHRRWKQRQRGYKESNPTPWRFEWKDGFPFIKDANGCVICTLSTGTLEGVYPSSTIIANAKRLLHFNE